MNSQAETNYEIVAIGDIELRVAPQTDRQTDRQTEQPLLACNGDAIENIWQQALKERDGKLFNGTLLNFVSIDVDKNCEKTGVLGSFVEYKHYLAQRKRLSDVYFVCSAGVA